MVIIKKTMKGLHKSWNNNFVSRWLYRSALKYKTEM